MDEEMQKSPIKIFPPLLTEKTGSEMLDEVQKKTGAPAAIVIVLTKTMIDNGDDFPAFTSAFSVGVDKKFLPTILEQMATVMRKGHTKDIG